MRKGKNVVSTFRKEEKEQLERTDQYKYNSPQNSETIDKKPNFKHIEDKELNNTQHINNSQKQIVSVVKPC